jgi:GPH family glycoside/pentoside/hexuronide:cation symporter
VSERIRPGQLAAFGIAAMPPQFMYLLVLIMYLKFAVDELGASAAAVGTVFLVAKLWDAISDPLVGTLSDRTTHRLGRRRVWIYASAPLLAVFSFMLWVPPPSLEGNELIAWIAVGVAGFYTAYTVFEVPHMSLGAEITLDPHERSRVFAVRQVARTLGMFAAAGCVVFIQSGREGAAWTAGACAVAALVLVIGGISKSPPERPDFMGRAGDSPFTAIRDVVRNKHARLMLFVFFIEAIGLGGIGTLTPFVVDDVIGMPEITGPMLGLYMVSALLGVPFWVWLSRYFEKRHVWMAAMIQGGVGYGLIFWVGEGGWLLMGISSFIAGSAGACANTVGYSLKSEVIDFDEHQTGERKEGAYFACWTFVSKLATGLMIFAVGYSLDAAGYDGAAEVQNENVKMAMIYLMGGVPMVGYTIGCLAFSRFGLTEAGHAEIRAELDARSSGQPN